MNTKIALSLLALALASACATGPIHDVDGFPPQVVVGQTLFPESVVDIALNAGFFPSTDRPGE